MSKTQIDEFEQNDNIFLRMLRRYKEDFIMPFEFYNECTTKNARHLQVACILSFFFGVFFYIFMGFSNRWIASYDFYRAYFLHFIFLSLSIEVGLYFFLNIIKSKKAQTAGLISIEFFATVGFSILSFCNVFRSPQPIDAIFGWMAVIMAVVVTLEVPPIVFSFFLIVEVAILQMVSTIQVEKLWNFHILAFAMIVLSFILWKLDIIRYKNRSLLKNINKNLLSEISEQNMILETKNKEIMKVQKNTIICMANLIEERSGEAGAHVKNTSAYVNLIAKTCKKNHIYEKQIDNAFVEVVTRAAPMHDVGKIKIPDSILLKPGRFTPEEYDVMKKHSEYGEAIISSILSITEDEVYLKTSSEIAMYHHERWDGKGYPKGIAGEEIPLCARIMAIADVYDALISPRCYKDPWPVEKAFALIESEAGKQFDPLLVEVFLSIKDKILAIHTANV